MPDGRPILDVGTPEPTPGQSLPLTTGSPGAAPTSTGWLSHTRVTRRHQERRHRPPQSHPAHPSHHAPLPFTNLVQPPLGPDENVPTPTPDNHPNQGHPQQMVAQPHQHPAQHRSSPSPQPSLVHPAYRAPSLVWCRPPEQLDLFPWMAGHPSKFPRSHPMKFDPDQPPPCPGTNPSSPRRSARCPGTGPACPGTGSAVHPGERTEAWRSVQFPRWRADAGQNVAGHSDPPGRSDHGLRRRREKRLRHKGSDRTVALHPEPAPPPGEPGATPTRTEGEHGPPDARVRWVWNRTGNPRQT